MAGRSWMKNAEAKLRLHRIRDARFVIPGRVADANQESQALSCGQCQISRFQMCNRASEIRADAPENDIVGLLAAYFFKCLAKNARLRGQAISALVLS
jgi:hypothetical protein